ncbi:hypothetical protein FIBSPDRAFT_896655 [Athelia psychrophila]|uniref:Uncharacterized protein n=1 Tax=Athelia psychrophila TaxID=1759441 RepID=A0A166D7Q4_9AGAM|nr:hypothetical protein FIBSPDRAFT_896655 [Fibularhizoctonia sp. CBS 109695]
MSNFVTDNASAGAEVTNVNGDIFNTNIYIVDIEHFNHIAALFAEARALDRIAARTRFNQEPRAHVPDLQVPAAAPAIPASGTSGIKETRRTKLLRRLGAYARARTRHSRTGARECTRDGLGRDEEKFGSGGLRMHFLSSTPSYATTYPMPQGS